MAIPKKFSEMLSVIMPTIKPEVFDKLANSFHGKFVQKREFLLKKGDLCNHVYYVEHGLFRYYHHVPGYDGKPRTACSWFLKEDDIILSPYSWYLQKRSNEYIQALEDGMVYGISRTDLEQLFKEHVEINIMGRILTEKYYVMNEIRLFEIRLRSAYDRYVMFHEKNLDLIKRVPISFIASYLDLSRESVHKVRALYQKAGHDIGEVFDVPDDDSQDFDSTEY